MGCSCGLWSHAVWVPFSAPALTDASLLDIDWSLKTFMPTFDVKFFTRENGDDLSPGVNELVRCYIAKKRK